MKRLVLAALFLVVGWLQAQETPMVITQPNGNYVAVINPSAGIVTIYAVDGNVLTRKSSVNYLVAYDSNAKVYRACFFDESIVLALVGTWDKDNQTMKWEGSDPGTGNKSAGNYRFVDKDHVEWSLVINGPDGKVVAELVAKQSRVK